MPGSVARLPGPGSGDGLPPQDIYRTAVEEYRFQAQYNWSRTQYLLGFNVAVLAAATAVATQTQQHAAALVFAFGIVATGLSGWVVATQHDYYRAARRHLGRVEEDLGVPARHRLDTTSTMGGRGRALSVNQLVYLLLVAIGVADAVGVALSLLR